LTRAGKDAADDGEKEYQQLVASFEGRVHLSKGRSSAVKARLKMTPKKKKSERKERKEQEPEQEPEPEPEPEPEAEAEAEPEPEPGKARRPRKRPKCQPQPTTLKKLAARYKHNHLEAKRRPVPDDLPDGEYVPEQIFCHSGESVLVGWAGYNEPPTWEDINEMPECIAKLYHRQGRVSLIQYCKPLDMC